MSMKEPDGNDAGDLNENEVEQGEVRQALAAAFDAAEAEEVPTEPAAAVTPSAPAAVEKAAPEGTQADATVPTPEAPATQNPSAALSPPASWSIEAKGKFAALDPIAQKEVLKREDDFHKGIGEYKEHAKSYRDMMQVINPYMPLIQAAGGTPTSVIQNMLNTAYQLQQNPQAAIQALAKQYNVTVTPPQDGEQQVDPVLQQLRQELTELKSGLTQGQQAQQDELNRAANDTLLKFKSDPKNVYFEDVKNLMASLIQNGEAKDVPDAYDKACWANPQVRAQRLQQEAAASEQKRIQEAKQKAANAKRASFDVSGSGAVSNGKSEMSLREQLEAAFPQ